VSNEHRIHNISTQQKTFYMQYTLPASELIALWSS